MNGGQFADVAEVVPVANVNVPRTTLVLMGHDTLGVLLPIEVLISVELLGLKSVSEEKLVRQFDRLEQLRVVHFGNAHADCVALVLRILYEVTDFQNSSIH